MCLELTGESDIAATFREFLMELSSHMCKFMMCTPQHPLVILYRFLRTAFRRRMYTQGSKIWFHVAIRRAKSIVSQVSFEWLSFIPILAIVTWKWNILESYIKKNTPREHVNEWNHFNIISNLHTFTASMHPNCKVNTFRHVTFIILEILWCFTWDIHVCLLN